MTHLASALALAPTVTPAFINLAALSTSNRPPTTIKSPPQPLQALTSKTLKGLDTTAYRPQMRTRQYQPLAEAPNSLRLWAKMLDDDDNIESYDEENSLPPSPPLSQEAQQLETQPQETPPNNSINKNPNDKNPKRNLNFALSASTAAGTTAATTYPFSAALSRGIANDMKLPTKADIAFSGASTTAARAAIQTGLIEYIRPSVRNAALVLLSQLAQAINKEKAENDKNDPNTEVASNKKQALTTPSTESAKASPSKEVIASEILALLGTNLIVTLITAPIENLAMMQNQSGKAFATVLGEVLKNNPRALFNSVTSAFISMNLSWSIRLYSRLKANGDLKKEREISTTLASINSPIKNFLRCVNSRQMVHGETLGLAALGTLRTMASRPLNTGALIGMNILLSAMIGTKMYHGIRNNLFNRLQQKPGGNLESTEKVSSDKSKGVDKADEAKTDTNNQSK